MNILILHFIYLYDEVARMKLLSVDNVESHSAGGNLCFWQEFGKSLGIYA